MRPGPDKEWITTEEAAELLSVSIWTLLKTPREGIRRAVRSPGRRASGSGYLWLRREVEYVAEVRQRVHLTLNASLAVLAAVRGNRFPIMYE